MTKRPDASAAGTTSPALYPIRAVARLTGLGIDTLRAWERRHNAVNPVRDDRGRLYTDSDVQRLRLLREVVTLGHSIGRISHLPDEELRRLAEAPGRREPVARPEVAPASRIDIDSLMLAVETFDSVTLETELGRAALLLRPPELLSGVLLPLLTRVGDDWHNGRSTVAQEHFVSTCVRSVLGIVLRSHAQRESGKRLLFCTPAGERHELGTLGAALIAAASGFGVLYLGADLPTNDLAASAVAAGIDVVVLGITGVSPASDVTTAIGAIAEKLPPNVELWVGGPAAQRVAGHFGASVICVSTYNDFQAEMDRIGH